MDLSDEITVVVPTSPIPSHPSTEIIEETLDSIHKHLPGCRTIVSCDGVRPEQTDRAKDYLAYIRRLELEATKFRVPVTFHIFDEFQHQSGMMHDVIGDVHTPLILYVEHDCPLVGELDFYSLAGAALDPRVNLIRLHHEASILPDHRHLMLDARTTWITGAPLKRTIQWSQRPHLAKTRFYKWLLDTYFGLDARTMIEDTVYGALTGEFNAHGIEGWEKFKTWLYCPEGDMKRSTHLDGRAGDPKFRMRWAYPDDENPPLGVPNPRWSDE